MSLSGKTALITGSTAGIGKAIAKKFLQEGATVWINGRDLQRLLQTCEELSNIAGEQKIHRFAADCTSQEQLQNFCQRVQQQSGQLDILVANVGDGRSNNAPISEPEHWESVWDMNFNSVLLTTRTFIPLLSKPGANVLFISSIVALEAFGAPVDYSTAKSAVNAFAKNLARKVAPDVRVNVIAPGNIYFEGGSWSQKINDNAQQVQAMLQSSVPMKRFGTPDEIANAAKFLCSDDASFITGSTLVVDGGQTVSGF